MSVFGSVQKSFVAGMFRKLFRVRIINPENEQVSNESSEAYIVCVNHSSNWDPIIIGACMHRPLRFMAKAELFKVPVLKSIIKLFGAYPVNRDSADIGSIRTTINILANGEVVGIYPQGRRAKKINPEKVTLKRGVAMVAVRAKTGILPVSIISKGYKVKLFHKTIVVFGEYVPFEDLKKFGDSEKAGDSELSRDGVREVTETKIKSSENLNLYNKITEGIYGKILENYRKYDNLNKN